MRQGYCAGESPFSISLCGYRSMSVPGSIREAAIAREKASFFESIYTIYTQTMRHDTYIVLMCTVGLFFFNTYDITLRFSTCVAACCSAMSLQHTAPHFTVTNRNTPQRSVCTTLHRTAPHYNTPHHCNTLQHTATHTATHCNTLLLTAPHCTTLHHTMTQCTTLQHTCNSDAADKEVAWHSLTCVVTYIHIHIYIYTHVYIQIHRYIHIYICIHIYVYVCTHVYIYIYIHVHLQQQRDPEGSYPVAARYLLLLLNALGVLQRVAACCSVLQCVAVRCSALQCVAVRCSALQCVAVRCSALQCDAVRCSVSVS